MKTEWYFLSREKQTLRNDLTEQIHFLHEIYNIFLISMIAQFANAILNYKQAATNCVTVKNANCFVYKVNKKTLFYLVIFQKYFADYF